MSPISRSRIPFLLVLSGCAADFGDPGGDEIGQESAEIAVCGTSIQSAIDDAPAGSVLVMCPGTYSGPLAISGKSLTLRGREGADSTIIDAGDDGPALVVANTPSPGVTVRGLTLRNGRNAGAGGGVRCTQSRLVINASVIASNVADGGGGLYASFCALTVTGTLFQNNDGNSRSGGGAWVVDSSGAIDSSRFLGNQAELGGGVAIVEGTLVLRDSEIRDNVGAVRGGGLYHSSNAAVLRTTIADNSSNWIAGGVYVFRHAPTIRASTIRGNTSVNDGGGLYIHQSRVRLLENTIAANLAQDDGGGVRVFESESRLEGNLIQNNQAGDGGGGVRLSHLQSVLIGNVVRNNSSGNIGRGIQPLQLAPASTDRRAGAHVGSAGRVSADQQSLPRGQHRAGPEGLRRGARDKGSAYPLVVGTHVAVAGLRLDNLQVPLHALHRPAGWRPAQPVSEPARAPDP